MKTRLRNRSWSKLLSFTLFTIFISSDLYAESRNGIQFDSNANIGFIHYGDNFSYAMGGSFGFDHDDDVAKTEEWELGIFARKNFRLSEEKTHIGFGISSNFKFGERDGKKIQSSFGVGPYFIIDYHVNRNIVLNAGAAIVWLKQERLGAGEKATSFDYFPPFFSLTYLF